MKTEKEIRKLIKETKERLAEEEDAAIRAGVQLLPHIKSYKLGAIWALEWALGKHG